MGRALYCSDKVRKALLLLASIILFPFSALSAAPSKFTVEFRHSEIWTSEARVSIEAPLVATGNGDLQFTVIGEYVGGTAVEGDDFYGPPESTRSVGFAHRDIVPSVRVGTMFGVTWKKDDTPEPTKTIILELKSVDFRPQHPFDQVKLGEKRRVTIHVVDDDGFTQGLPGLHDTSFKPSTKARLIKVDPANKLKLWGINAEVPSVFLMKEDGDIDRSFESYLFEDRLPHGLPRQIVVQDIYPRSEGVYVCGTFTHFNGVEVGKIVRLNYDGSLDPAFRSESSPETYVNKLAFDDKESIYAIGRFKAKELCPSLRKLNLQGVADSSYRQNALGPRVANDGDLGYINDIQIDWDGKLLLAGYFNQFDAKKRTGVVRLDETGALDESFRFFPQQSDFEVAEIYRVTASQSRQVYVWGELLLIRGFNGLERLNESGARDHSWLTDYYSDRPSTLFIHGEYLYAGLIRYSVEDGSADRTFPAKKLGLPSNVTVDAKNRLVYPLGEGFMLRGQILRLFRYPFLDLNTMLWKATAKEYYISRGTISDTRVKSY